MEGLYQPPKIQSIENLKEINLERNTESITRSSSSEEKNIKISI